MTRDLGALGGDVRDGILLPGAKHQHFVSASCNLRKLRPSFRADLLRPRKESAPRAQSNREMWRKRGFAKHLYCHLDGTQSLAAGDVNLLSIFAEIDSIDLRRTLRPLETNVVAACWNARNLYHAGRDHS